MKLSEQTKELFTAMANVQGEIKNAPASRENPFFKSRYTPLDVIVDMARPLLKANGLSVMQFPCSADGRVGVITLVTHTSGQFIESDPVYFDLAKKDAQAAGSAITYSRRYSLAAVLGIATDPDDDGNQAVTEDDKPKAAQCKCVVCNKVITKKMADQSIEKYGKAYCSGECKEKGQAG